MVDNPNMYNQKKQRNEIRINLNFSSNQFYSDVLNNWCQTMTQEGIARILKPHYSKESVENIKRQITLDPNGCFEIKKIILDAFVIHFSGHVVETKQNSREQDACSHAACPSRAAYAFKNSAAGVLCFKHKLKGMVLVKACRECGNEIQSLKNRIADLQRKLATKRVLLSRSRNQEQADRQKESSEAKRESTF